MTLSSQNSRPLWNCFGALYDFLSEIFPDYRTTRGALDVPRIHGELNVSHEAVYKWLRANRLTPKNARSLHALSVRTENLESLAKHGRMESPKIEDFNRFVYG